MNKQILKYFLNYHKHVNNRRHFSHLNRFNVNIFRQLSQSSNQRFITFDNNQTNSNENSGKQVFDKTKAKYLFID